MRALVDPDGVLGILPTELATARARNDHQREALLQLARANACRVKADWPCQRDAGIAARKAAEAGGDAVVALRGLVAEARAYSALKDYSRASDLLGEAELRLKQHPQPELSGDVLLGYSSMSHSLGRYAMSAQYARRGLEALGNDTPARPMQARLLRNLARAQTEMGEIADARETLRRGQAVLAGIDDPKLTAEMALEAARAARAAGDIAAQRQNGERVLGLGRELVNSQLAGLGREVLGNAAYDAQDWIGARQQYAEAVASFRALDLKRDELRVLRSQIQAEVASGAMPTESGGQLRRLFELSAEVEKADRAQSADDFDARLKYAQQEQSVAHLQREAELSRQRAQALAERNRLILWLELLTVAVLVVILVSYLQVRRAHARLQSTLTALHEREAQASSLLHMSKGCVLLHDIEGRIIMANPATATAFGGGSAEAMAGKPLQEFLPAALAGEVAAYLAKVADEGSAEGVLVVPAADGGQRNWRFASNRTEPGDARPFVVGQAVEITEQARQVEALREQGLRDVLTGAFNRREVDRFEASAAGRGWGVIAIDLDGFKQINDFRGHEHGDTVLVSMAQFIGEHVRADDSLVRMGGDEFVVLLPDATPAALEGVTERLHQHAPSAACRFSLGSALREGGESLASTLARADEAMYAAKRARRS
ncbi:sensor domain-containing diguanylate cyclase [Lysobacter solisilvae (ex Woo and Kim 2020)]|uniref:diguanylate cyclase n=1 Tax=Agrilutibacter terrestris TaxID=2865112 RepID=A0A7H0FX00_9GAMM|nr:sensor domain-containing diguanylate cyclase [Lysobacter terrestris]QNP40566.1 diguanylate cyclase [Lysobacter terrestris]